MKRKCERCAEFENCWGAKKKEVKYTCPMFSPKLEERGDRKC